MTRTQPSPPTASPVPAAPLALSPTAAVRRITPHYGERPSLQRHPIQRPRAQQHQVWARLALALALCLALCGLKLSPAAAQSGNPQVTQGGSNTFAATGTEPTVVNSSEIVNPAGSVIASFPYPRGGSANGWTLSATGSNGNPPTYSVTAPSTAAIGSGYKVRSDPAMNFSFMRGSALFDVVAPPPPAPPAPSGLSATAGNTQIALSWSGSSGATSYKVKRATTSGGPYAVIATATSTSYTDSGLNNGTTYYYVVSAVNAGGESANSAQTSATPVLGPPPAPTGLTATRGDSQLTLSWGASATATSYNLKRATVSGGPYTTVATPGGTSYTDIGLTNGTTYYYVVTALNASGEGPNSNQASGTPQIPAPPAPAGLSATPGDGQVVLSWTASAGAGSYRVKRALSSGGPYTLIDTPSGTTYTDSGVNNGTTYYYVVSAVGIGGESAPSNQASATPQAPPPSPLNLQAVGGDGVVYLTWTASARTNNYEVWRSANGGAWSRIATPTAISYNDTSVTNGVLYEYSVRAINVSGASADSNHVTVTPQVISPYTPGAPTFSNITSTSVLVTAPALPMGATSLTLQRRASSGSSSSYANVASGLAGGAQTPVSGLTPNSSYTFRYVAVGSGGSTAGAEASLSTPPSAPGAPAAPAFSSVTLNSLTVFLPPLPPYANSLSLQQKLQGAADSSYTLVEANLSPPFPVFVSGLSPATAYTFRLVAVGAGGSTAGPGADVTTAPPAPGAPSFSSITSSSVVVTAPALPTGATSLTLQQQGSYNASTGTYNYTTVASGLGANAPVTVSGLTPGASYSFRYLAVGAGGATAGSTASVTLLPPAPGAPAAPAFSGVGPTSLTANAPSLPPYASSLTLQKKLQGAPDSSYLNVATGITSSGQQTTVSGLSANSSYTFRYVAVGSGGSTPGVSADVTTPPPAPGAPTFSNITTSSVTVIAPALPAGATSLTLQQLTASDPNAPPNLRNTYSNVATGLSGGAQTPVSGLNAGVSYTFLYVAVGAGGGTSGPTASVTTSSSAAAAPGAPGFGSVTSSSVLVTAPRLPSGASSLSLQQKLASDPDSSYVNVATGITAGGQQTTVSGLLPATAYSFRYVAVNGGGSTPGPGANVTTTPPAPGAPTFSSVTATGVVVNAPALPAGASSLSLQRLTATSFYGFGIYSDVATGLAAGAQTPVSGLTPNGTYTFHYVAVGAGGGTAGPDGNVTTLPPAPGAPEAPTFSNVGPTSLTANAPPLPAYATSFTLQQKLQGAPDSSYVNVATGIGSRGTTAVTGLSAATTYTFRYLAVGSGGSTAGAGADVMTTPPAPDVPTFSSITSSSVVVTMPALPAGATSLTLQQQVGLPDRNIFIDVATGLAGGAQTTVSNLTPSSSYTYRGVAVDAGGGTAGNTASVTTLPPLPGAPEAPVISNLTASGLTANAPPLPLDAASLTLQQKLQSDPDSSYSTVATGIVNSGTATNVSGLTAQTAYAFRYLAVNASGSTAGAVATVTTLLLPAPDAPGPPTISNVGQTSLTATLPPLPNNASSLTLQQSVGTGGGAWTDVASGQAGGATVQVTGLVVGTMYWFRCVALGPGGSTPGNPLNAAQAMTAAGPPPAPGAPSFSNLAPDGVTVTAPALPSQSPLSIQIEGAFSLRLQSKLSGQPDSAYGDLDSGLSGGAATDVAGLESGISYDFRYVMDTPGNGSTPGAVATLVTPSAAIVSWGPGEAISCAGIRYPQSGQTLALGATGRLSAYLATDWDEKTVSFNGTSTTTEYSDTCSYTWSDNSGRGNAAFQNGVNSGQSAQWIAPSTPGTYTITLVVDDQGGHNQANGEGGSRDDAAVGYNDDPLKFSITITVQ